MKQRLDGELAQTPRRARETETRGPDVGAEFAEAQKSSDSGDACARTRAHSRSPHTAEPHEA